MKMTLDHSLTFAKIKFANGFLWSKLNIGSNFTFRVSQRFEIYEQIKAVSDFKAILPDSLDLILFSPKMLFGKLCQSFIVRNSNDL